MARRKIAQDPMAFFAITRVPYGTSSAGAAEFQLMLQRAHRYSYDHAMFLRGARVTEVVTSFEPDGQKETAGPSTSAGMTKWRVALL
jgi:hypothetical protein